MHEPTRSESEGEPSGGAAIFSLKPKHSPKRARHKISSRWNKPVGIGAVDLDWNDVAVACG